MIALRCALQAGLGPEQLRGIAGGDDRARARRRARRPTSGRRRARRARRSTCCSSASSATSRRVRAASSAGPTRPSRSRSRGSPARSGTDGPHAPVFAAVLEELDAYERELAPPPPGQRFPLALRHIVHALIVARTPDVPLPALPGAPPPTRAAAGPDLSPRRRPAGSGRRPAGPAPARGARPRGGAGAVGARGRRRAGRRASRPRRATVGAAARQPHGGARGARHAGHAHGVWRPRTRDLEPAEHGARRRREADAHAAVALAAGRGGELQHGAVADLRLGQLVRVRARSGRARCRPAARPATAGDDEHGGGAWRRTYTTTGRRAARIPAAPLGPEGCPIAQRRRQPRFAREHGAGRSRAWPRTASSCARSRRTSRPGWTGCRGRAGTGSSSSASARCGSSTGSRSRSSARSRAA